MKKFIKQYWMPLAIIAGSLTITFIKLFQGEFAFAFVALTLVLVAFKNLLLQLAFDDLHEDYTELVIDFNKELSDKLDFIQKSRNTLLDIMSTVDNIKEEAGPVLKEGKPKKRPTKKNKLKS